MSGRFGNIKKQGARLLKETGALFWVCGKGSGIARVEHVAGAAGRADAVDLDGVAALAAAQGAGQDIAALVSLGYSQSEAALAVSKIDGTLPVEEIIKLALRGMAGRR